jgi:class 3 adenylate cyclase
MAAIVKIKTLSKISFAFALSLILAIVVLYAYNIIRWGDQPDIGLYRRMATGIHVVGMITEPGVKAGVQVGDHVLRVNGKAFRNRNELLSAIRWELGEKNTYLLEREGQQFEVTILNTPLGLWASFIKSGLPFLVGLCYILIGTLVFLMKPHQRTSWIFFLFSAAFGLLFTFLFKVGVPEPFWLGTVDIFLYAFTPAAFLHLSLVFPEERNVIKRHPHVELLPYLTSATLFVCIRSITPEMLGIPKIWFTILIAYLLASILLFLGSCLQLRLSSRSEIVKLRARMILLGVSIGSSLPVLETFMNSLFRVYIVSSFNYYLPFLVIFPTFIGYSIVKHNLFDFDAIIKRTYGYILTTVGISGIYVLILALFNYVFGGFEHAESPIFTLFFALAAVFLFNPVRHRVQKIIDRAFFRLEYDYQETVHKISETMRSLMSLDQIGKNIMDTALGTIFIDSGRLMLLNPREQVFECLAIGRSKTTAFGDPKFPIKSRARKDKENHPGQVRDRQVAHKGESDFFPTSELKLPVDDLLLQKIAERKKEVTRYDIQEDPFFRKGKEAYKKAFERLEATLIVPLIYEDRLTGLISLGDKKSGKYYRKEDINLLNTLANQGAVAIENAKRADQMKKEEAVRANLARYLSPQIVDQIIKNNVQVNLGGDKKVVTVLFSDIRNFTRISETLPPDQLMKLLNEYFTEMARIIFENQGSLDKYIGDAIVAVFGSLISLYNPARSAVQTAIQMMKTLSTVNERWTAQYGFAIHIGIGINTGEVFLGNIGSPERMEFTIIGDTVNIASRFSGAARPGQILITRETLVHLGSDMNHQELPPIEVKGKTAKLEVFEIIYS